MKKKLIAGLCIILAVVCFAAGYETKSYLVRKEEPKITTASISQKLSACSDLTTAVLDYRGLIRYEQGDIPWINKKGFSMIYTATLKAGIDLSQAQIRIRNKTIDISLPQASIQSVDVDESTLEFYDEKLALFNWTNKEDTTQAIQSAKEDAQANADTAELTGRAQKQAQNAVKNLMTSFEGQGYQIKISVT